jgi:hypothetical protein
MVEKESRVDYFAYSCPRSALRLIGDSSRLRSRPLRDSISCQEGALFRVTPLSGAGGNRTPVRQVKTVRDTTIPES